MSDDLVSRLREPLSQLPGDDVSDRDEAATALTEARAEIKRLIGERDEARGIVRDTYWMAVRYADGRMSYAPGMCNRAIQKAYDAGWLTYHDHKQHDHDPQYAREGDRPEYRSIEDRARAAESELSTLRARVREVVWPFAEIRQALELISANKPGDELLDERAIFQTWGLKDTPTSKQITLGHLRAARQLNEDLK